MKSHLSLALSFRKPWGELRFSEPGKQMLLNSSPAAVFAGIRRGQDASGFTGSFGNSTAWTSCFPVLLITELELVWAAISGQGS